MQPYDLIVIGGGPGGYNAAQRAASAGMKVALFEQRALGGVCLNEGCIPSKTLLNSAKYYRHALHGGPFGVTAQAVSFDHSAVLKRKDAVVAGLVRGVRSSLKQLGATVVSERALIDGGSAGNYLVSAGGEQYAAARLLVATGSEPLLPPIPGAKEGLETGFVVTNREILQLAALPKHLVVVGGGVIGLEMACYFNAVGCRVTVVELLEKIAGATDGEISALLQKKLADDGIDFRLGCRVAGIGADSVTFQRQDCSETLEADKVLLSVGRRPVTQGFGLAEAGVYLNSGAVVTDRHLKTNVPGLYAAGDVGGKLMLAHTAYREGEAAVNHMLGKADEMRYEAVPSVIYTDPEVAGVGETEESAAAKGLDIEIARVSMYYSGRFLAETHRTDGLCKLLVERGSRRVVGVHVMGSYASEMIWGAVMMIECRWPLERLRELVFPHPTVSEVIREALFQIK